MRASSTRALAPAGAARSERPAAVPAGTRFLLPGLAAAASVGVVVVVLVRYSFQPTPGAITLLLGWVALVWSALALVRTVRALDFGAAAAAGPIDDRRRDELVREKRLLLKAIKEIEFDHLMGKVADGDAAAATARYRGRALEILRLLDDRKASDAEAAVEAELARRLARTVPAGRRRDRTTDRAGRAAPAATAAEATAAEATGVADGACACGTKNDPDADFCKRCGHRLRKAAP